MTRILLLRHGESEWNAQGRWQGQSDPDLSPLGRLQALHAAPRARDFEAIVSSDLRRAAHTAEIIAEKVALGPVRLEPGLRERAAGPWEGLSRDEIESRWPGYLAGGRRPDGFEAGEQLLARTTETLLRLASEMSGALVLAVTHGGVIRAFERSLGLDDGERIPNLGGRWIEVIGETLKLGESALLVDPAEITRPAEN